MFLIRGNRTIKTSNAAINSSISVAICIQSTPKKAYVFATRLVRCC